MKGGEKGKKTRTFFWFHVWQERGTFILCLQSYKNWVNVALENSLKPENKMLETEYRVCGDWSRWLSVTFVVNYRFIQLSRVLTSCWESYVDLLLPLEKLPQWFSTVKWPIDRSFVNSKLYLWNDFSRKSVQLSFGECFCFNYLCNVHAKSGKRCMLFRNDLWYRAVL